MAQENEPAGTVIA